MDLCVKLAREFKRADKALINLGRADEAKHQVDYDRATFMLTVTKPESLPGAGELIYRATRLACGAVPDDMQQSLFFIGARLKKGKCRLDDVKALREAIRVISFLAVDGERAPVQISFSECGMMGADNKDDSR